MEKDVLMLTLVGRCRAVFKLAKSMRREEVVSIRLVLLKGLYRLSTFDGHVCISAAFHKSNTVQNQLATRCDQVRSAGTGCKLVPTIALEL